MTFPDHEIFGQIIYNHTKNLKLKVDVDDILELFGCKI